MLLLSIFKYNFLFNRRRGTVHAKVDTVQLVLLKKEYENVRKEERKILGQEITF